MNKILSVATAAFLSLVLAACSSSSNTQQSSNMAATAVSADSTPIDPTTVATISGTVKFDGAAPTPKKIDMRQDPACTGDNEGESLVVAGGQLANVFVYVKDGLGNRTFKPPATAAIIDQRGCRYYPHVLGAMTGQTIQIRDDDPTTHNIHPMPRHNREWNVSQTASSPLVERSFPNEEIMMPMKCNLHPWMRMYINIVKSPFFAVTDQSGKYEIQGLPPGDYTIAFVQEKLGEHDEKVTLGPKESRTLDATFKAQSGQTSFSW